jgi:GT2 family glycosyltransferase/SAM-dependent methyltransferase/glycosyltransferase involved in cell wall biosynthesis
MTTLHRPVITFFHTDNCERQALSPVAREAERRGFPVRFSTDLRERAQVGVYCQHACRPNAELSAIMLHDLAQRHDIWPAFWDSEPWNAFDLGFVPGEDWVRRWRSQSGTPQAHPRLGVFDIGWPKADLIGHDRAEFDARVAALRASLGLRHPRTVLYAPSWENHGKQDEFVRALIDLPVNLLLKQAPWSPAYTEVWNNIHAMNALHQGIADNVRIVDPEVSIMYCIGLADVLVSDESSVLLEAALHEVPSVAVTDWLIPDTNPPRPASVPYGDVRKTTRARLRATVEDILRDPAEARAQARRLRDFHFSHFGCSAPLAVDLLEAAIDGRAPPVAPLGGEPAAGAVRAARPPAAAYRFDHEHGIYERPRPAGFAYNDGDHSENRVWSIVASAADVSLGSEELVAQADDWPTLYHLSPVRGNLFRPIEPVLRGKKVLELGSGCGAMSRFLGEAGCDLTCVEGSRRRAAITAARCRGLPGVRVFNDNFQHFETDERFEVVTLIGVLEYSRSFIDGDDPVAAALALARSFLTPDGILIVAIENQLGLKYFAGAPEDHIGVPFHGIEGLYGERTPVTFGRRQLDRILKAAGFPGNEFLYPFPDYKLPVSVIAEAAFDEPPALLHNLLSGMFPPDQASPYLRTFSEGAAFRALVDNGLVGDLANSFLIVARQAPEAAPAAARDLAFTYSVGRRRAHSKEVRIQRRADGVRVARRPLHPHAAGPAEWDEEALIPGELLFNRLLPLVNRPGWGVESVARWIQPLHRILQDESSGGRLPGRYFDATPFNAIEAGDAGLVLFDLEWAPQDRIEVALPLFRGLFHSFLRMGTVAPPEPGTPHALADLAAAVTRRLTGSAVDIDAFLALEAAFMREITLSSASVEAFRVPALQLRPSQEALRSAWSKQHGPAAPTPPAGADRPLRIAAVLHLYYPEMWPEFSVALERLPQGSDLFVTTVPEHRELVQAMLRREASGARLIVCENRGRDVGPFLAVMEAVRLEDYDYVLKVHSKKSPHLGGEAGSTWRQRILGQLLPEEGLDLVWDQFRAAPRVGLLAPGGHLLDAQAHMGRDNGNHPAVQRLAQRLGFDFDRTPYRFAAGTMFWMRGDVVRELRGLGLRQDEFEDEAGQLDGTLAHAVERIMPLVARRAGLETDETRIGAGLLARLMAQVPSASDGRLIEQRLAAHGGGPVVGVFVRDLAGDEAKLVETLSSLVYGTGLYANLRITVLTAGPVGRTSVGDPVHLVAASDGDWVDVLNLAITQCACDWIVVADAGDVFSRAGLLHAALRTLDAPDARAVCCDELRRLPDGTLGAAFRPDVNLDLLMSLPASMARHWLFRRERWLQAGGFDPVRREAAEFDLLLRLVEQGGIDGLLHAHEPLMATDTPALARHPQTREALLQHLRRRGYPDAAVDDDALPGRYRVRYGHAHRPLVSIVIPTRDQLPILQRCVESLLEKTAYPNYEVLIVDNASETEEARHWLAGVEAMQNPQVRILRHPGPFNYSAINNRAAALAGGEYLVLLNNDTAILRGDWLDALLNHALRPEVGVVGAKLLYPNGGVQHAGVVLGLRGPADHPFLGQPFDAAGYMHRLEVDQDYSAVTGACLMVRKSVYDEVGGLDEEAFKVSYNDVDLCLKVRTAGYLVVWTPHAVVMHEGSVSQTRVDTAAESAKQARFAGEQDAMYERWLPLLARDPAYNRHLALHGDGFEFEPSREIRWQPLAWRPVPVIRALAADQSGCGHYRIIQPLQAMVQEGLVQGLVGSGHATPVLLERYAPDTLVFQRQMLDAQIESMRRARRFSSSFKVYELDDYLPGIPAKSAHWGTLPTDIVKSMRRALAQVDRFVVSTDALADAFAGFHADIRVVRNRLPPAWWAGLQGARGAGRRPRVGWAGGGGHRGDLELIADVVRELAGEVEWVFFGMCPEPLRRHVGEFHPPVDIERYPATLASLDLDLALAPLEKNLFNECKSNLRLLEYGACGFPVVCSDIGGYQDAALPVTRVKNRFKDWVAAIRMHLADRDATARAGDALQEAVRRDWMLQGEHLRAWRDAWTAG